MQLVELLSTVGLPKNCLTDVSNDKDKSRLAIRATEEQLTKLHSMMGDDVIAPSGTAFRLVVKMKGDKYFRPTTDASGKRVRGDRPEYIETTHGYLSKVASVSADEL